MKRTILQKAAAAALFVLLTAALLAAADFLLVDDVHSYSRVMLQELHADAGNIDTLFLGSSHCYRSVDPAAVDAALGTHSFNAGSSQQLPDGSYYMLREAAAENDLKTVYLEMFYTGYNESRSANVPMACYLLTDHMSAASPNRYEYLWEMGGLAGFADLLLDEDVTPEEQHEYLQIIRDESKRLAQLSGSVLLLNRIEAQTILTDCTDFSLDEQLRQCILVTRQKWRDKPLQFEAELAPCTYHGSEALVKEIWLNLLDNAAKFSPENGIISVTLHREQGSPVVAVTDQGCGMDAETCRHIFEQFYQGDTSHRTQGNGLGLAMAQKIAALHGGAVTVDSRPGSGSCFTVVLK